MKIPQHVKALRMKSENFLCASLEKRKNSNRNVCQHETVCSTQTQRVLFVLKLMTSQLLRRRLIKSSQKSSRKSFSLQQPSSAFANAQISRGFCFHFYHMLRCHQHILSRRINTCATFSRISPRAFFTFSRKYSSEVNRSHFLPPHLNEQKTIWIPLNSPRIRRNFHRVTRVAWLHHVDANLQH